MGPRCIWALAACLVAGCAPGTPPAPDPMEKVRVGLAGIDDLGLVGPPESRRPVGYEFCVPNEPELRAEVRDLDHTARFVSGAPGAAGCTDEQILVIGSTFGGRWQERLRALATLPYVERIVDSGDR